MSELSRRMVHASGSVLPLAFLAGLLTYGELRLVLVAGSAIVVVLEVLRLGLNAVPSPLDRLFEKLTRDYEEDNPGGYALYAFSITAVALVFPPYASIPGMLMLTLGDPVSGVLGSAPPGEHKRPAVLAAMFAVCFGLAMVVLPALRPGEETAILGVAAAVGALGATFADGVKPIIAGYVVDDNATIPPMAAVGIAVVLRLS